MGTSSVGAFVGFMRSGRVARVGEDLKLISAIGLLTVREDDLCDDGYSAKCATIDGRFDASCDTHICSSSAIGGTYIS